MVRKCALVGGFVLALWLPGAASAASCTKTWIGPGGSLTQATDGTWETPSAWSPSGIPASTDNVCITVGGTYTVMLAPSAGGASGADVASLTLGSPTAGNGTQTLDVVGQSSVPASTTLHKTILITAGGTASASGKLVLDATAGGAYNDGLPGGNAEFDPGAFTNAGQIITQVDDPQWGTTLGPGTITNSGAIEDVSGVLTTTANTINEGGVAVASGATDLIVSASFANAGTFANAGITAVEQQTSTPVGWAQAGPELGNPIELRQGATLVDSAGAGQFVFDTLSGGIVGTIPAGQTVTVRGEANNTTVSLGGGTASVINHGDLVLEAPGSGTSSGGSTHLTGGPLLNFGRLVTVVEDPSWANYLQVPLTNEPGGLANVSSGVLHDSAALNNYGTAEMAPDAHWALDSGSSFVNETAGELEPDLAGPNSYGTVDLSGGALTAGGTLAPFQVEGYVPAANTEFAVVALRGGSFSGTFAKVLGGFSADYSHESSTAAFVGAIYHKSSTPPPPPPKKAVLRVGPVKGGRGTVAVQLSCSGSGTCVSAAIVVTAAHGHVVARGGATVNAGRSKTVTLKVKTKRKEQVSVTVSAAGRQLTFKNVSVSAQT